MTSLFRNLRALRSLCLTSLTAEPNGIPPHGLWRSLSGATKLDHLEIRNLPDLPALDPAQIPPASLPSLRRVAISHCSGLLEKPDTWAFLAGLPNLTDLDVDATARIISIAASVFGAMADAEDDTAKLQRLSFYGHFDPDAFADARDA
eukprot:CAMPEP_0174860818 /NCGR_PEP_ID=MMETSP1114-20130205/50087_1 /TAXON_ID=312471 /ORGANISM="Neobodo designis, Strain CCAP 1951/1" /LENGTH=147 /DNA_ID=CAMNT_0016095803 /DNA_START=3 /DNA_END=443 /DNA_ORIENTATION=+